MVLSRHRKWQHLEPCHFDYPALEVRREARCSRGSGVRLGGSDGCRFQAPEITLRGFGEAEIAASS
eukprot:7785079-Alexandrium_andersonii.AAC.1